MKQNENDAIVKMYKLWDKTYQPKEKLSAEEIDLRKRVSRRFSYARDNAKLKHCVLCEKESSSFCNSHSVPQFALHNIAEEGMVSQTLQNKAPMHEKCIGVKQAGTFHIICNSCDSKAFQEYENPDSYRSEPTNKMLAQIALKDYLLIVDKRLIERELFTSIGDDYPQNKSYADEKVFIENLDLVGYLSEIKYAQKAIENSGDKYYHLCYYKVLDYVVPYTAQSGITLVGDFNDEVVNNICNLSPKYKIKDLHIAVFPLETQSVIMLFTEDGDKRYRKFYRQLKKLSFEDQLSAINYMIFANTENVFLNPKVQEKVRDNEKFMDICRTTTETIAPYDCPPQLLLSTTIKELSLSKRFTIPNLLSKEYALKKV